MLICLAPMEGVVDYPMRQLLTEIGGFDRCVTEFVRVTNVLLPERVFFRLCPELRHGCHTKSGVPVHVQLLGGDPAALALNAVRAVALGAPGIDLNFGCPAKTVNRSDGGSVLLKTPSRVADIVGAVRDAVDPAIPVSAKIRLGFDNTETLEQVVEGISAAGANELCIHARTKSQGYKPPAYWHRVADVTTPASGKIGAMRVIINGEIWDAESSVKARENSHCRNIMLGRGALSMPDLALQIRHREQGIPYQPMAWPDVFAAVEKQFERSDKQTPRYIGNRTKQWLAYLKRNYQGAEQLFARIKPIHDERKFLRAFDKHRAEDLQAMRDAELSLTG